MLGSGTSSEFSSLFGGELDPINFESNFAVNFDSNFEFGGDLGLGSSSFGSAASFSPSSGGYAYSYNALDELSSFGGQGAGNDVLGIQNFYPANDGFLGDTSEQFLNVGDRIDRNGGSDASRFFSPQGTPPEARALPPNTALQPLRTFEVMKPFPVQSGTVAPAYGQFGFGTQFRAPVPLRTLLSRGILREVTP